MQKSVLITGGAGFIGSHVADYYLKNGYNVVVLDNFSTGAEKNIDNRCKVYNCDLNSPDVEIIFKEQKIDLVLHFAAQISVVKSQLEPLYDANTNILGTLNLIQYSKKYNVEKFIAASSAAVYGDIPAPINEEDRPYPQNNYGISKLAMENYIKNSDLNYLILRFANIYGSRQSKGGEAGVITIFNDKISQNQDIYIDGSGEQIRDFVFVEDLAKIIFELSKSEAANEVINISTGKGTTINQLFSALAAKYNYKKTPIHREKRKGDIDVSILDNSKLLSYLNSFEFVNIEQGLDSLVCVGANNA